MVLGVCDAILTELDEEMVAARGLFEEYFHAWSGHPAARSVPFVVTNRDRGQKLVDTVGSVAASSHPNLEIIVVDDASTGELDRAYLGLLAQQKRDESGVVLLTNAVPCGSRTKRSSIWMRSAV